MRPAKKNLEPDNHFSERQLDILLVCLLGFATLLGCIWAKCNNKDTSAQPKNAYHSNKAPLPPRSNAISQPSMCDGRNGCYCTCYGQWVGPQGKVVMSADRCVPDWKKQSECRAREREIEEMLRRHQKYFNRQRRLDRRPKASGEPLELRKMGQ